MIGLNAGVASGLGEAGLRPDTGVRKRKGNLAFGAGVVVVSWIISTSLA